MIDLLLIFEETGILLKKIPFSALPLSSDLDTEELISGFFSVMFQYFSMHFGKIHCITTEDHFIFVRNLHGVYVSLVVSQFKHECHNLRAQSSHEREIWLVNKRLEEIATHLLTDIATRLEPLIINHRTLDTRGLTFLVANPSFKRLEDEIIHLVRNECIRLETIRIQFIDQLEIIDHVYSPGVERLGSDEFFPP